MVQSLEFIVSHVQCKDLLLMPTPCCNLEWWFVRKVEAYGIGKKKIMEELLFWTEMEELI